METIQALPVLHVVKHQTVSSSIKQISYPPKTQPGYLHKKIVWFIIKLRIFYLTCIILKRPALIIERFRKMLTLRDIVWGGNLNKIYKVDGKYYFNQYTPGWPSKLYDNLIKSELRRHASANADAEKLSFVFFAITRKCPMRCEHCFEWDNLNLKESFLPQDLYKVIDIYQQQGVLQFHFSGGEPMARFKELLPLVVYASKKSECWVLSSGFNFTHENARLLKVAGLKGVVISIDHYIPELHNMFRGHAKAFDAAVNAIEAAKAAGLVTALSVCATKQFIDANHLLPYMEFANKLEVQFVQVLEPRMVGHYEGKPVMLQEKHIVQLEEIFKKINYDKAYQYYPTMVYHGYHQRRVGCFSGSRSVYIDSAGDVHACPFCHTASYNIIDLIRSKENKLPVKENRCPQFEKIA